ncbi:hypothetical protein SAMN05443543_11061 [Flavobacterium flevense]|uniref:O-antigen polymerase n=1 Tax=Flavobacterium flevense TaxID=983 RepID=A0A4Y4AYF4_9FLAO|nr:hypothetical protein [Flavobacterium flevense]GEC72339.1 hypothetical protein FFL01_18780 [Flavobacterium flevense]SHM08155.1 hypothetical protein SAMN05443543_11061 [Flavobacterium flevense]
MDITKEAVTPSYKYLKSAIWLYFILWIFEGALRKWILPGLATPLLVVRDPVAIYIIIQAFYSNVKFLNPYVVLSTVFTLLGLAITLTFGHANLFVSLYGARIMLLHFPLIFIIGSVFSKEDVLKTGYFFLAVNILMAVVVYFQFISPQTAYINVGLGGEGSSGFSGALGYSRPSGTFSFITGLACFYISTAVYIFYFWLSKEKCSKLLLIASTLALIFVMPLTISRGAVMGVLVVGFFAIMGSSTSINRVVKVLSIIGVFAGIVIILNSTTSIFSLGTEVFLTRVDNANQGGTIKESIFLRMYDSFKDPIVDLFDKPLFLGNLGMGTNAGAQMLNGNRHFIISEGEIGRLAGEQGLIFGGLLIGLRLFLSIDLFVASIKVLKENNNILPIIFCGTVLLSITQGQWAQPSILGSAIIVSGLLLATINTDKEKN